MKNKITNYFYDSEDQHKNYKCAEYLVITAIAITVIYTIIRLITV